MGVPERQCIGCGCRGPQDAFVRLTATDVGGVKRVMAAKSGSHVGRGAYLCKKQACLERALSRRAFQRAFKASVEVDRDELESAIGNADR